MPRGCLLHRLLERIELSGGQRARSVWLRRRRLRHLPRREDLHRIASGVRLPARPIGLPQRWDGMPRWQRARDLRDRARQRLHDDHNDGDLRHELHRHPPERNVRAAALGRDSAAGQ